MILEVLDPLTLPRPDLTLAGLGKRKKKKKKKKRSRPMVRAAAKSAKRESKARARRALKQRAAMMKQAVKQRAPLTRLPPPVFDIPEAMSIDTKAIQNGQVEPFTEVVPDVFDHVPPPESAFILDGEYYTPLEQPDQDDYVYDEYEPDKYFDEEYEPDAWGGGYYADDPFGQMYGLGFLDKLISAGGSSIARIFRRKKKKKKPDPDKQKQSVAKNILKDAGGALKESIPGFVQNLMQRFGLTEQQALRVAQQQAASAPGEPIIIRDQPSNDRTMILIAIMAIGVALIAGRSR